ncbi:MAG: hypothetical protein WBF33_28975 [Candidatus Nitrosopolaris sp.]|jgi:hypothetical protein
MKFLTCVASKVSFLFIEEFVVVVDAYVEDDDEINIAANNPVNKINMIGIVTNLIPTS